MKIHSGGHLIDLAV